MADDADRSFYYCSNRAIVYPWKMTLLAYLKKKLVSWRILRDPMTAFGCASIFVQRESTTLNLGVPPSSTGGAKISDSKRLVLGLPVGAFRDLKLTNPAGVLGVWSSTRASDGSDTYSS